MVAARMLSLSLGSLFLFFFSSPLSLSSLSLTLPPLLSLSYTHANTVTQYTQELMLIPFPVLSLQGPPGRPGLAGVDGIPGPPGTLLMLPVRP